MRVPITVAPPAPIMLPVPQLPGGDPFDNDLFALSPLHPNNRPLVEMLLKFPQTLLNPPTKDDDLNDSTECAGNCVLSEKQEDAEQDAKDARRMSDKEQKKAAIANGYEDEHDLKDDFGLNSKTDIFVGKSGELYEGNHVGSGTPQPLGINKYGR